MTRADRLAAAIDDFLAVSPDVEGAAIVSPDGFPIASALPVHVEEDRLAAMSAALLILGERSASELGKGNLAQIFVEGPYGHVVIMAAGGNAVLVAVTSKGAKVGLVIFEMRATARRIATTMQSEDIEAAAPDAAQRPASVGARGAGSAGPQDRVGAGSAGPQDLRGAGSAGPQDRVGAGSAGPQDLVGTGSARPHDLGPESSSDGGEFIDIRDREPQDRRGTGDRGP
jgi:predicted regulator of Ras-like GTPase activity (Roadblock/LC7/MglB family)